MYTQSCTCAQEYAVYVYVYVYDSVCVCAVVVYLFNNFNVINLEHVTKILWHLLLFNFSSHPPLNFFSFNRILVVFFLANFFH